MFYIIECETALLGLPDIEKCHIISVHCGSILIQKPTLIHETKDEQTDPSKGAYKQAGLTDNTHSSKHARDIEQYFVDDGEKEYDIGHIRAFTK